MTSVAIIVSVLPATTTSTFESAKVCVFIPAVGSCGRRKLKFHLVRTESLNVFPFKPEVGQYIAIHATLTARVFFLAYFYPSGPFTCVFSKPLPISPVLVWLTHGSRVGPQNTIGHPAGCRFPW